VVNKVSFGGMNARKTNNAVNDMIQHYSLNGSKRSKSIPFLDRKYIMFTSLSILFQYNVC